MTNRSVIQYYLNPSPLRGRNGITRRRFLATSSTLLTVNLPAMGLGSGFNQRIIFGALTLEGHGGVPWHAAAVIEEGNTNLAVVAGRLVPLSDGVRDGVLRLADGTQITVETVPNAFSVAPGRPDDIVTSLTEVNAAFQAARFGQRVLLRNGDYGKARVIEGGRPEHGSIVNVGYGVDRPEGPDFWRDRRNWPTHKGPGFYDYDRGPAGRGDPVRDGPIVIEPHPHETPTIWRMAFGNVCDVTVRGLKGRMEVVQDGRPTANRIGVFMASGNRVHNLMFDGIEVETVGAEPWIRGFLTCYVAFHYTDETSGEASSAGMPGCGVVNSLMHGGAYDGVKLAGQNFRFENNHLYDVWNDGITGSNVSLSGLRILWNVIDKSASIQRRAAVLWVEYGADGAVTIQFERGAYSTLFPKGPPDPARSFRGVNDCRWGLYARPDALAKLMPRQPATGVLNRLQLWFDPESDQLRLDAAQEAAITVAWRGTGIDPIDTDLAACQRNFRLDGHEDVVRIETPGMFWAYTTAHPDFTSLGGTRETEDVDIVGNIFTSRKPVEGPVPVGGGFPRMSGGSRDMLVAGNIVAASMATHGAMGKRNNGYWAYNLSISIPDHPAYDDKAARTPPRFIYRRPESGRSIVVRNVAHQHVVAKGGKIIDLENYSFSFSRETHRGPEAKAFIARNFHASRTNDRAMTPEDIGNFYRPVEGSPIPTSAGPWGAPIRLLDIGRHHYDRVGLRSHMDDIADGFER